MELRDGRVRKRRRSLDIEGHAHELTFTCYQRKRLLNHDRTRKWLVDAFDRSRRELGYLLLAYVVMPDHAHVLVFPREPHCTVAKMLKAIKLPVARRATSWLRENNPAASERLRVERPTGRVEHRFWQQGGGYDRNIYGARALEQSIDYIHLNPVRAGLVRHRSHWRWSSAPFFAGELDVPIIVDRIGDPHGSARR